jgi:hypothetical protein
MGLYRYRACGSIAETSQSGRSSSDMVDGEALNLLFLSLNGIQMSLLRVAASWRVDTTSGGQSYERHKSTGLGLRGRPMFRR